METSIGAISRIRVFARETPAEEDSGWQPNVDANGDSWPYDGRIEFKSVVAGHK